MANSHGHPSAFAEAITSKDPHGRRFEAGLEVVHDQAPLYPVPSHAPLHTYTPKSEELSPADSRYGSCNAPFGVQRVVDSERQQRQSEQQQLQQRRMLGLTVPVFWAAVAILITVILAGAIGGGVGGALSAKQKQELSTDDQNNSSNASTNLPTPTTSSPAGGGVAGGGGSSESTDTPLAPNPELPTDGCPNIDGVEHMPFAVNGRPIPLDPEGTSQRFKQQCYTNWISSPATQTHNIMRIFLPTLETCISTCAEYNSAYRANLKAGIGVGGGYCVAVTLVKEVAEFCYLKNATVSNNTMGKPESYSSAVLLDVIDV